MMDGRFDYLTELAIDRLANLECFVGRNGRRQGAQQIQQKRVPMFKHSRKHFKKTCKISPISPSYISQERAASAGKGPRAAKFPRAALRALGALGALGALALGGTPRLGRVVQLVHSDGKHREAKNSQNKLFPPPFAPHVHMTAVARNCHTFRASASTLSFALPRMTGKGLERMGATTATTGFRSRSPRSPDSPIHQRLEDHN